MDSEGEPLRFYDDPTAGLLQAPVSDVWHRSFWSRRTDRNGCDACSSISSSSTVGSASMDGRLSDSGSATWSGSDGKRWITQNPDFRKILLSNDATTATASSGTPGVGFGRSVSLSHDMSALGKPDDVQNTNGYTFFGLPREIKVSRRELNMMTPSSF